MEGKQPGPEDAGITSPPAVTATSEEQGREVINPETPDKRLTAEDAQKAKEEKEVAMTKLMDDMEASVATQGNYFIRIGDKIALTEQRQEIERSGPLGMRKKTVDKEVDVGSDDRRILILKARTEGEKTIGGGDKIRRFKEDTLITRAGIFTLRMFEESSRDQEVGNIIERLRGGAQPTEKSGFQSDIGLSTHGEMVIGFEGRADDEGVAEVVKSANPYGNPKLLEGTVEDFQKKVQASIDQTESPHKRIVQEQGKEMQLAKSASEMIGALPPRS